MTRYSLLALSLALCSTAAVAQGLGLPDEPLVQAALDDHPSVVAARARAQAARAEADALRKGPHEFTFTGSYIRRSVDLQGEFNEYDASLTRPIRLPGKGRLDRDIGLYGVEAADNLAEDAKHQAALLLAGLWFDWVGASAQARVDRTAVGNYERALAALIRRVELGDAAQLDADLARAALGNAKTIAERSQGEANLARARLSAQFPSLPLAETAPDLPVPDMADPALVELRNKVEDYSHEIAAAEAEARRRASMADRAQRERTADPSVGVRLFSERGGEEKGAGLVFSMPLGGGQRRALADRAAADRMAADAELNLARFAVTETAESDLASARYRIAAWQRARESLDAQVAAVVKLRRGYELGEIDLSELLLGERLVHDAFREEAMARADAQRAITRLRIDSHELWLAD